MLEHSDEKAQKQHAAEFRLQQRGEGALLLTVSGDFGRRLQAHEHRTLGDEEAHEEEERRRRRLCPEHPAPSPFDVPSQVLFRRDVSGQKQIHHLCRQYAQDDGHLVEAHHPAANVGRRDFGDIHGGQSGGHTDAHAAHKTGDVEEREVVEESGADGRYGEENCRSHQQRFPSEAVGQSACDHRAEQTAHERRCHRYALKHRRVGDAEIEFVEGFGSSDDHPVVAKQQSAHGRDRTNEESKAVSVHKIARIMCFRLQRYGKNRQQREKNPSNRMDNFTFLHIFVAEKVRKQLQSADHD